MATISKKKQKAIAEAISKATKGEVDTYTAEEVVAALKPCIEKDPIHIIHGARTAIEQLKNLPEPVHIAVNRLLENVVTTYVNKNITQILDDVFHKAKEALFKKFSVKFMRTDIGSIKAKPSPRSLISQLSGSKTEIKKGHVNGFTSAVSFGSVTTIGTIKVLGELRSTKGRPPTPVPSLTELAEVIFREPVSVIDIYADEFNTDQHNYERLFMALYAQLLKAVLRRTEKSLEKQQQLLYSPEKELTMEAVSQKLTNVILTKHIENLADSEEMQLAIDTLVRQVLENYEG